MAGNRTLEYELTLDDVISALTTAFDRELARHANWRRQRVVSWSGGLAILLVFLAGYFLGLIDIWRLVIGLIACSLLVAYPLIYFVPARRELRKQIIEANARQPGRLAGKHKLQVSPEAVIDSAAPGETSHHWTEVEEVAQAGQYLLIFSQTPLIVPASAFKGEDDFRQFSELARRYHQTASKPR